MQQSHLLAGSFKLQISHFPGFTAIGLRKKLSIYDYEKKLNSSAFLFIVSVNPVSRLRPHNECGTTRLIFVAILFSD
jgi:hypothetical protein